MMLTAHRHMESLRDDATGTQQLFTVLGGFLSPSSDCYVGPKCNNLKTTHVSE